MSSRPGAEAPRAAAALPDDDRPHIQVRHKTLLTLTVMMAVVMQVLDSTIANVALPHMQASLGATPDSISWVLTSYIVASAIVLPATGWLTDRVGTRTLLLGSVLIFVLASMLCGMARSLPFMVFARLLQGLGGAFLGPLGQAIIFNINRRSDHAKAMAFYSMGMMVGPITGPIIGGWLTDNFNWRWVFFVNVPVGVLCFAALWMLAPKVERGHRDFDVFGWALIAVAIAALQLMLDRGEHVDWFNSGEILIEAGVAIAAAWVFLVHSVTTAHPLFPRAVIRDRNMQVGLSFACVLGMIQMSTLALLPGMLQGLFGYSVIFTGSLLTSRGLGMSLAMWTTGRIMKWVDARLIMGLGMTTMTFANWQMTGWSLDMDSSPVFVSGLIQGIGLGLIFVPLSVISFSTLPAQYRADAAGLFMLARNLGASVGIAVGATMLARNVQTSHSDLAAHVTPYNLSMDPTLLGAFGNPGEAVMRVVDGVVNQQAAMVAYLDDFYMMLIGSLFTFPLLLLVRPAKGTAGADDSHLVME